MKAIRTKDTKEWVRRMVWNRYQTNTIPTLVSEPDDTLLECAITDTGHPCEWVDVEVVASTPTHSSTPPDTEGGVMSAEEWLMQHTKFAETPQSFEVKTKHLISVMEQYATYVSEIKSK